LLLATCYFLLPTSYYLLQAPVSPSLLNPLGGAAGAAGAAGGGEGGGGGGEGGGAEESAAEAATRGAHAKISFERYKTTMQVRSQKSEVGGNR
jgi:Predicted membrane protein